jgi:hypothetical protein
MTFLFRNLKGEINKLPSLVEECLLPMDEEKDRWVIKARSLT